MDEYEDCFSEDSLSSDADILVKAKIIPVDRKKGLNKKKKKKKSYEVFTSYSQFLEYFLYHILWFNLLGPLTIVLILC